MSVNADQGSVALPIPMILHIKHYVALVPHLLQSLPSSSVIFCNILV